VSLVFVVWGFVLLRRLGGSDPAGEAGAAFEWENTGHLVTTGIYRLVRHPMYSSLFFLTWGVFLKSVTVDAAALSVLATLALTATARNEEAENVERFGDEYREYIERTARFVPFVF
jgi:protein-S-isoprenylcysteine O-methyltransferase Ste14